MGAADNKPFDEGAGSKEPFDDRSYFEEDDDSFEDPGAYHPNQLEQVRLIAKKSQSEIAEYLGVSNRTVSAWERGTRELRADAIIKLCDFLGCTPNELLGYGKESLLPKPDIYEEHIYTVVHGLNNQGKEIIYRVTDGIALDAQYQKGGKRKKKRSHKRNRSNN